MENRWTAAQDYDQYAARLQKRNAAILANAIPNGPVYGHALDAGCGTGFATAALLEARPVRAVTAVDVSREMLSRAERNLLRFQDHEISYVNQSITNLPESHSYDLIISNAALHWTYPDIGGAINHLAGLLRPCGYIAFTTAGRSAASEEFDEKISNAIVSVGGTIDRHPFRQRRISTDEAIRFCEGAGLDVIEAFVIERTTSVAPDEYVAWAASSGRAWAELPDGEASLAAEILSYAEEFRVGHWSTLIVARSVHS